MNQDKIDAYNLQLKERADEQAEQDAQKQYVQDIKDAITTSVQALILFQAKNQPKVSVTNQKDFPTSIKTPDIQGVIDALKSIELILTKPEADDTRELEAINALNESIKSLSLNVEFPELPEPVEEVTVKNQPDYKPDFKELNKAIKSIDVKPVVNIPEDKPDDYTPIIKSLKTVVDAIANIPKPEKLDLSSIVDATSAVKRSIDGLVFPVANYVLPFKDGTGKATQSPTPFIDLAYDEFVPSGHDANGIPSTITYKNGGVTVRTLTLTVSGGNIVDVVRT